MPVSCPRLEALADPRSRAREAGREIVRYLDVRDDLRAARRGPDARWHLLRARARLAGDVSLYFAVDGLLAAAGRGRRRGLARARARVGGRLDYFEGELAAAEEELALARAAWWERAS